MEKVGGVVRSVRSLVGVFRGALGRSPSEVGDFTLLGIREAESIRAFHAQWASESPSFAPPAGQLWPVASHHGDNRLPLRAFGSRTARLKQDTLTHLLVCNGVILADPLRRVFFDEKDRPLPTDVDEVRNVARSVALLEPLLDSGAVHITAVHPSLNTPAREQYLEPFQLGPGLRRLTDLVEEGYWRPSLTRQQQDAYQWKEERFLAERGIGSADFEVGVEDSLVRVEYFARGLMEVSWQLATAIDTGADLYLTNPIERRIFEVLIEVAVAALRANGVDMDAPYASGRHLGTIARVGIPRLNADNLTIKDAVASRQSEAVDDGLRMTP